MYFVRSEVQRCTTAASREGACFSVPTVLKMCGLATVDGAPTPWHVYYVVASLAT